MKVSPNVDESLPIEILQKDFTLEQARLLPQAVIITIKAVDTILHVHRAHASHSYHENQQKHKPHNNVLPGLYGFILHIIDHTLS